MASLDKVEASMGRPVFFKNGIKIYFKAIEPRTKRGKRRIEVAIRVPNHRWRNDRVLQTAFGLNVQYVNVKRGETPG
jgi:hypothetical protein